MVDFLYFLHLSVTKFHQGGLLKSCAVESFVEDSEGNVIANLQLEYETNKSKRDEVLEEFHQNYSEFEGKVLEGLTLESTKPSPEPKRDHVSQIRASSSSSTILPNYSDELQDVTSTKFKETEGIACNAVMRSIQNLKTCAVASFENRAGKIQSNFILERETDEITNAGAKQEFINSFESKGVELDFDSMLIKHENIPNKRFEPRTQKNLAYMTSTVNVNEPLSQELDDKSSSEFVKAQAKTCAALELAVHIESCYVDKFYTKGSETLADIRFQYPTDEKTFLKAKKHFEDTIGESEDLHFTKPVRSIGIKPGTPPKKVSTINSKATVDREMVTDLQDRTSNEFIKAEGEVCAKVLQDGVIKSCKVNSFKPDSSGLKTEADIVVDFETDELEKDDILADFKHQTQKELNKIHLQSPSVTSTKPVPSDNISNIKVSSSDSDFLPPFSPELEQFDTDEFVAAQGVACNAVKRASFSVKTCHVDNFKSENGRTKAVLNLGFESSKVGEAAKEEFLESFKNEIFSINSDAQVLTEKNVKPPLKKNLFEIKTATKTVDKFSPDLETKNSQKFLNTEAKTCGRVEQTASVKSCEVERFTSRNGQAVAHLKVDYETDETSFRLAEKDFAANFDREKHVEFEDIKVTDSKPNTPKETLAKISASTKIPIELNPNLEYKNSDDFIKEERKVCEKIQKSGIIKSCKVDRFVQNGVAPIANVELEYESDETERSEVLRDFISDYTRLADNTNELVQIFVKL